MNMLSVIIGSARNDRAATVIEYAFIAGLISIAAVAAFNTIGASLVGTFSSVASSF